MIAQILLRQPKRLFLQASLKFDQIRESIRGTSFEKLVSEMYFAVDTSEPRLFQREDKSDDSVRFWYLLTFWTKKGTFREQKENISYTKKQTVSIRRQSSMTSHIFCHFMMEPSHAPLRHTFGSCNKIFESSSSTSNF